MYSMPNNLSVFIISKSGEPVAQAGAPACLCNGATLIQANLTHWTRDHNSPLCSCPFFLSPRHIPLFLESALPNLNLKFSQQYFMLIAHLESS